MGWVLLALIAAVPAGMGFVSYLAAQQRAPADTPPATAPAAAPAAEPAPPPATPAAPPARPARSEWTYDTAGLGQKDAFVLGSLDPASGYAMQVEVVRAGAAVHTLKLSEHFATDEDKLLFDSLGGDHAEYMARVRANPGKYKGHYSLLNPVGRRRPYATRSITVAVAGAPESSTIYLDRLLWRFDGERAVTQPAEGREIRLVATLYRDRNGGRAGTEADYAPALRLEKTYTVGKDDFSLEMALSARNLSKVPMKVFIDQVGPIGVPLEELHRVQDDRFVAYGKIEDPQSENVQVLQRAHAEIQEDKAPKRPVSVGRSDAPSPAVWIGHNNKFFGSMVYLRPMTEQRKAPAAWLTEYYYTAAPESATSNTFLPAMRIGGTRPDEERFAHAPALSLLPGTSGKTMRFSIFAGPKKRDMLSDASTPRHRALYERLNYLGTINFRSCFCSWNALTLGMMWLLQGISKWLTFGNYGVAIMILVVLVRLVLHPLTKKSQVSMMKMQKLAPEMEKIKKKYADDKETLQRETMRLYKQQGATPLLGCLPMLLQMPIWISLWSSLNAAVELRHARFLPVWITNLAGPDALVSWSTPLMLPIVGGMVGPVRSFNLLPILLTVAMFLQTKLNPQMSQAGATASPEQQTQKKLMMFMMPVMMLLIFYNAASGLTLYIMTSTFAGVAEQFIIRRHIAAKEAEAALTTTTVKVPGKAPRTNRPKKPKGPFFTKRG